MINPWCKPYLVRLLLHTCVHQSKKKKIIFYFGLFSRYVQEQSYLTMRQFSFWCVSFLKYLFFCMFFYMTNTSLFVLETSFSIYRRGWCYFHHGLSKTCYAMSILFIFTCNLLLKQFFHRLQRPKQRENGSCRLWLSGSPPTFLITPAFHSFLALTHRHMHHVYVESHFPVLLSWSLPRWEEWSAPWDPHPPKLEALWGWGRQVWVGRPSRWRRHRRQRGSSATQRLGKGENPTAVLQRNPIPTVG